MDALMLATFLLIPGVPLFYEWLRGYSLRELLLALVILSAGLAFVLGH